MRSSLIAGIAVALAAGAAAAQSVDADIVNRDGEVIGTIAAQEGPHGVLLDVEAEGLPPGAHAIHIHAVGTCDDAAEGFQASGGHVNPDDRAHGLLNPDGPDAGDLPNVFVADDGSLRAQLFTDRASLGGGGGRPALLDDDGAAVVMHEGADDHTSQPIGGAGARIACAALSG